jgi:hypothetical protein
MFLPLDNAGTGVAMYYMLRQVSTEGIVHDIPLLNTEGILPGNTYVFSIQEKRPRYFS